MKAVKKAAAPKEYVVEKIVKSIVHYKRGKKLVWKFLVKWEGYADTDNTWEPEESFKNTSLLRDFWQQADTGGRDIGDASLFQVGEEFTTDKPRRGASAVSRSASARRTRTVSAGKRAHPSEDEGTTSQKRARPLRAGKKAANDENEDSISASAPRRSKRQHNVDASVSDQGENEENAKNEDEEEDRANAARGDRPGSSKTCSGTSNGTKRRRSAAAVEEDNEYVDVSRASASAKKRSRTKKMAMSISEDGQSSDDKLVFPSPHRPRKPNRSVPSKKKEVTSNSENEQSSDDKPLVPSPRRPRKAPVSRYRSAASRNRRKALAAASEEEEDEDAERETVDAGAMKMEVVISSRAKLDITEVPESPGGSLFSEEEVEATTSNRVAPELTLPTVATLQADSTTSLREKSPVLPPHRARAANPLVKFIDDPRIMKSVKARLGKTGASAEAGPSSPVAQSNGAGPSTPANKPSLLTATKGQLKMRKGRYAPLNGTAAGIDAIHSSTNITDAQMTLVKTPMDGGDDDMQDIMNEINTLPTEPAIVQPPSGDELLRLAGLVGHGGSDLPDFDADAEGDALTTRVEEVGMIASTSAPISGLMSFGEPTGVLSTATGGAWRIGTIFEPATPISMKFGLFASANSSSNDIIISSKPILSLRLDPSNSVPVVLKDVHASKDDSTKRLTDLLSLHVSGPPGKLYADGVLDHVSSGGSSARLVVDESADAVQIACYQQLQEQLNNGKLFIAMLGGSVLIVISSKNHAAGEKLGVAGGLLGLSQTAVIAQVSIENGSAYANYAMDAEDLKLT